MSLTNSDNGEGSSTSTQAPQQALTVQNLTRSFSIAGVLYTSAQQLWDSIKGLEPTERVVKIREVNLELGQQHWNLEDLVVDWGTIIEKEETITREEKQSLIEENPELHSTYTRASTLRKQQRTARVKLDKVLEKSERGMAFQEFLDRSDYSQKNVKIYSNLTWLFGKCSARESILRINHEVLKRNAPKELVSITGLRGTDIQKARSSFSSLQPSQFLPYIKQELQRQDWVFDSSGLLLHESFFEMPFPAFVDEEGLPPIVVEDRSLAARPPLAEDVGTGVHSTTNSESPDIEILKVVDEVTAESDGAQANVGGNLEVESAQAEDSDISTTNRLHKRPAPEEATDLPSEKVRIEEDPLTTPKTKCIPRPVSVPSRAMSLKAVCTCECHVPVWWLKALDDWELDNVHISTKMKMLEYLGDVKNGKPCKEHLFKLADFLSLRRVDMAETTSRLVQIYDMCDEHSDFKLAWVHPILGSYFLETPTIKAVRKGARSTAGLRYMARQLEITEDPSLDLFHDVDLEGKLVYVFPRFINFWKGQPDSKNKSKKPSSLFQKLQTCKEQLGHEIKMRAFHQRRGELRNINGGLLNNGYYTMASQVVTANPILFLFMHCFLPGHPTAMVSHPMPARLYKNETGQNEDYEFAASWLQGLPEEHGVTSLLCGEWLLEGGGFDVGYDRFETKKFAALCKKLKVSGQLSDDSEFRADDNLQSKLAGFHLTSANPRLNEGNAHIYPAGLFVMHSGKANNINCSVPFCISAVWDLPGEGLLTDNEFPASDILTDQLNMALPTHPRLHSANYAKDFPLYVQVEGLGPISDMMRGLKDSNDPVVIREIKDWLAFKWGKDDMLPINKFVRWLEDLCHGVDTSYHYLERIEMEMFEGESSYFQCLKSKHWPADNQEDNAYDPDAPILISDDEEVEPATLDKGKGKQKSNEVAA